MKHIFVVNPCAGQKDHSSIIRQQLEILGNTIEWEMYITRSAGDATEYVRQRATAPHSETLRFYACGGDGTLNEVLTGMAGCPDTELAAYPCGSGNDYIKYYGLANDFLDLNKLVNGNTQDVDVMRVGNRFALNVCNFGFDALVCKTMDKVRRWPLLGGSNAYTTGILRHIFTGRRTKVTISVNNKPFYDGSILLCTLANGQYVGGKYRCAPHSDNNDGMIEINLIRPMSLIRFARLIGPYADGTYTSIPGIDKVHRYCRATEVEINSPNPLYLCVDGEVLHDTHFHIINLPKSVRFVSPSSYTPV